MIIVSLCARRYLIRRNYFVVTTATSYGKGVYFARDFLYSSRKMYSPPDKNGIKYIFQCKVLTGEFVNGKPDHVEPPSKKGLIRFNSVVDNADNPMIFVVFKDAQAYPEYLISFTWLGLFEFSLKWNVWYGIDIGNDI